MHTSLIKINFNIFKEEIIFHYLRNDFIIFPIMFNNINFLEINLTQDEIKITIENLKEKKTKTLPVRLNLEIIKVKNLISNLKIFGKYTNI